MTAADQATGQPLTGFCVAGDVPRTCTTTGTTASGDAADYASATPLPVTAGQRIDGIDGTFPAR